MKDKFVVYCKLVVPIALALLVVYYVMGKDLCVESSISEIDYIKTLPFLFVIVSAICGMHVILVLIVGLMLCFVIGLLQGCFDVVEGFNAMQSGLMTMADLIIMAFLAGGLLGVIRHNGGIEAIIAAITKRVKTKRSAELSLAFLVALVNVCTANNTIALITISPIAADLAERFCIDRRKAASILDTSSCCAQGLLPYGSQALIAAGLAGISPISIVSHLYYPMAIGLATIVAIIVRYPKQYS